jgi:hypothetical protein
MKNYLYISLCVAALFSLFSCQQPDEITTSSDARLEFELDTLRFDTVFTELGSATRYFKVYTATTGLLSSPAYTWKARTTPFSA